MIRQDPHARYEELAAGHALHSLEPEDEQEFVAHLSSCARCSRELAEHEATLAHLAYSAAGPVPPPSVLEGIRAGVRASDRGVTFPGDDAGVTPLVSSRRKRDLARLRQGGAWVGIAAAAALVISLGVWNVALQQDRDSEWSGRIAEAVSELRDGATDVTLRDESGEVVAVALLRGDEMSLVVDGLPVNPASTTYVLWGETSAGERLAVGTFDVSEAGLDVLDAVPLQASVDDVTTLMVTREPGEVAPPTPTLPVLAVGTV